jgi:spore coat protein SA
LHICMIAPEQIPVPPVIAGSVEICMSAFANELSQKHEITIISRSHPKLESITKRGQLTIIRVSPKKSYIDSVLNELEGKSFDLIQVDNRPKYAARIKAMFPDTPVSLFLHSLTFVTPPHITKSHARACLNQVDLIVANSRSLKKELRHHFPECQIPIYKTFLGVDPQEFCEPSEHDKQQFRRKYKVHHTFNVLFVGRIIRRKGIHVLIQAIHMLKRDVPNVRLLIAGGALKKKYLLKLKRYAALMQVPTTFIGYIPHRQLPKVYWLGDCFVCPSQKHEAFGLVNVEAMASGVPVVASAIGGIKEIIRHGTNGLLVRRFRYPGSFAKTILKLVRKPSYAENLRVHAHQNIQNKFTWTHAADRLEKIYLEHLKDR